MARIRTLFMNHVVERIEKLEKQVSGFRNLATLVSEREKESSLINDSRLNVLDESIRRGMKIKFTEIISLSLSPHARGIFYSLRTLLLFRDSGLHHFFDYSSIVAKSKK
jgi:hypothetical protein